MSILAIHQPAYLPWLGYLDRIARVDVFAWLDTVQFEKNSYTNRNRVRTPDGRTLWLTVPLLTKGHTAKSIREMKINPTERWQEKHLKTLEQCYHRAPHFAAHFPEVRELIATATDDFAGLALRMLRHFLERLAIPTRIVPASELGATARKGELVLELCAKAGADRYLSGPLGREYLDPAAFAAQGIALEFHDFRHPEYPQAGPGFVPALGCVDALFNLGAAGTRSLLAGAGR